MPEDALSLIREAADNPTYDELMRRDPKTITREQRRFMIEHERQERAMWEAGQKKKADKKAEKEAA